MTALYTAEIKVMRHAVTIGAVQRFFEALCDGLQIPEKTRLEIELALEEGLTNLFQYAMPEGSGEPVGITLEFRNDAVRIVARAAGRPFDFQRLPEYRPLNSFDDQIGGLGNFLLHQVMDSVQWRYVEKEGQELVMVKNLPVPIDAALTGGAIAPGAEAPHVQGRIAYRLVESDADALSLAACAYDIYRYAYKDVIYYPRELLSRVRSGQMRAWIAVDEGGTVLGHYAMIKKSPDDPQGEMGAAFVRPEFRKDGIFRSLADVAHEDALNRGLRGLYSLSVTNHTSTQKASEKMGRISVGIRLASSPAIFVEGAKPGDRVTTVLNYRQLADRPSRDLFIPGRYRAMVLGSYRCLGISVAEAASVAAAAVQDVVDCQRDPGWNRALINACGGEGAAYKLRALTELLVENGIVCIFLSIDLEDPGCPRLAEAAAQLGYFYSGIFPESLPGGHDALQFQHLNGITVRPEEILLHQEPSKEIMAFIRAEAPQVFAA